MTDSRLSKLLNFYNSESADSFIIFAIAKEYEKFEKPDKALKFYLELKEKDSKYIGLYYHLAKLYEKLEQRDLALSTYDEGLELAKELRDFHALSELNNAKMNYEMEA